jgi:recombination protein RecR
LRKTYECGVKKLHFNADFFSFGLLNKNKMIQDRFPSKLLENAVEEFAKLPGIGRKTALRLVLHLLRQNASEVEEFGQSIITLRNDIKHCKVCHNISDTETCFICSNPKRNEEIICVVESIREVLSIENTHQFNGRYHVLGGVISPMDGVGPNELEIQSLVQRVATNKVIEVILALSTTMEGDTTNFYIYKKLKNLEVKVTTIARGVSVGGELEYTDELTLGRSIVNRISYSDTLNQ